MEIKGIKIGNKGVFHLPRDSSNSGRNVNGTHVFGRSTGKFQK